MKKHLSLFAILLSLSIIVFAMVVIINQTAGIVLLASSYNPQLGRILLYALLLTYCALLLSPLILYFRMPPALRPPDEDDAATYKTFLASLKKKLAHNDRIKSSGLTIESRDDIENALAVLDIAADNITKSTASTVFVSTAISQNGRLDALMVLLAQFRLIHEIATVYHQRPSLREMAALYANVAATALVVGTIEELDIEEQIEPIITPLISGSIFGGIPGASGLTTFMTTSVVDGAANALLTLRVGVITRKYFGLSHYGGTRELRRSASLEAGNMLASIVVKSAGYVSEAVLKASKKRAGALGVSIRDTAKKSAGTVAEATKKSARSVMDLLKKTSKSE